jgi:hypothetical protein
MGVTRTFFFCAPTSRKSNDQSKQSNSMADELTVFSERQPGRVAGAPLMLREVAGTQRRAPHRPTKLRTDLFSGHAIQVGRGGVKSLTPRGVGTAWGSLADFREFPENFFGREH